MSIFKRKPIYRQGGGSISGLANTAGSSLEQASQAIMEASNAIGGGGGSRPRPGLPGLPGFPPSQPGLPGLQLPDFIDKIPGLGGPNGLYNESQALNRGGPVYRQEGGSTPHTPLPDSSRSNSDWSKFESQSTDATAGTETTPAKPNTPLSLIHI